MDNIVDITAWPPRYEVKKHKKAKQVKLRASRNKGLQITIPPYFNLKHLPDIIEKNKLWILKHLQKLENIKKDDSLPIQIHLNSLNKIYTVFYISSDKKLKLIERPNQELVLYGKIEDKINSKKLLLRWVKSQAKIYLNYKIKNISEFTNLEYKTISIKNQNTLWGSCTREKKINLNFKLIFLPENLTQHILIHELAHTKHMNHSKSFWGLVAKLDPKWEYHRHAMRKADEFVPGWV